VKPVPKRFRPNTTLLVAFLAGGAIALQPGYVAAQQPPSSPPQATGAPVPKIFVDVNENKPATQGSAENGYRVDSVYSLGPLGTMKLLDTPYSIMILPEALIENAQVKSVKEALKYLPLVQFQEQQGSEILRPATRGMQASNFQNARMDGMTIFITGGNAIEQIQQIEVLSGPSSAVYGPANPAGMFNFVTKRPTDEPLQQLNLSYDSSSIFTAHADLGGHFGDNGVIGYRVNLLAANGTGFVSQSELDRKLGSVAIDVRPLREMTVELNYSAYEVIQKAYPGWFTYGQKIDLPAAPDPTRVGYGQTYAGVDLRNQTGSARVRYDFDSNWHLVAGALVQRIDRNINTPVNNLTNNAGDYISSLANGFAPRFGINSNIVYLNGGFKTGDLSHDLTVGTTGYRATTNAVSNPATPASVLLGSANISDPRTFPEPAGGLPDVDNQFRSSVASQQGVNVSDTITFTREWLVRLALSQDWIRVKNYNKTNAETSSFSQNGLSPMPSIIYKPRENMTAYVTYASSLQQGDLAPAGSTNANTGLAPYRSKQWEAGLKLALPNLDLSTAVFRLERPFANVDPVDNTFKISGDQVNYGLEVLAIGQIADNLIMYGGMTLLDPKLKGTGNPDTDNKQFVGMPKFRSNFLFEYRVPTIAGFVVSFDWQYAGRRSGNDTNTTWAPSYSTFDLGARYATRLMGKSTTWRLALNNLADERYWSTIAPSNITGTNTGNMVAHIGAPRTVAASVSIDF
jgi:iron complex outermembrane receptor protein